MRVPFVKRKINILLIASALFAFLPACKKYPDGPLISFHSKAERVANAWKVGQALDNGNDVTSDYNKYYLNLLQGGGANLTAKYTVFGTDYEYYTNGRWSFVDDKNKISFDFDNDNADGVYQILKLEEDEMWLKKDGGTLEFHFVPQ